LSIKLQPPRCTTAIAPDTLAALRGGAQPHGGSGRTSGAVSGSTAREGDQMSRRLLLLPLLLLLAASPASMAAAAASALAHVLGACLLLCLLPALLLALPLGGAAMKALRGSQLPAPSKPGS
jgi:hypothetical protein